MNPSPTAPAYGLTMGSSTCNVGVPLQTSSAVCSMSSGHRAGLRYAPQTIFLQPIANCLITNKDICSLLEIIVKSSSCRPTITACHSGDNDHDALLWLYHALAQVFFYTFRSLGIVSIVMPQWHDSPRLSATAHWVAPSSSICTALTTSALFK